MIGQISLRYETLGLFNTNIGQTVQTSHLTIFHTALNTHMAMQTLSFSQDMPPAHRKDANNVIRAAHFLHKYPIFVFKQNSESIIQPYMPYEETASLNQPH